MTFLNVEQVSRPCKELTSIFDCVRPVSDRFNALDLRNDVNGVDRMDWTKVSLLRVECEIWQKNNNKRFFETPVCSCHGYFFLSR